VRARTGLGADIVVDAVGTLLEDALRCVRKGGRVVLFGMHEQARPVVKQYDVTKYELQILGTFIARGTFPLATQLLESGRIDFPRLVTHRLPLRDIAQGIELWFGGRRVHFRSPLDSRHSGIEMVYQDLGLADNLSAIANIFLGREVTQRSGGLRLLNERGMDRLGRQHLDGLQISLPSVAMPVERLSGGQRQSVAIARATAFQSRLVIMDEPAASLAVSEAAKVLALIKRLKGQGVAVILISHRLQDVLDVADRVVVLNRGTKVGDLPRVGATMEQIVGLIVGKAS
jgi:ABC-type branched-subunit amino acid transport system ATPase component